MDRKNSLIDNLICALVAFLVMSLYLFEAISWGRYVYFGVIFLVFCLSIVKNNMTVSLYLNTPFHIHFYLFIFFCLISSLWAWVPSLATSKFVSLSLTLITFSLIYPYYQKLGSVESLLKSFMFGGFGVAIYTLIFYGEEMIARALEEQTRIDNDFANANSISLIIAMACIILVYYLLQKKLVLCSVFLIPSIIVLAIAQSRKAFIMLILGVVFLIAFHGEKKNFGQRLLRIAFSIGVAFLLLYLLSTLDMFSGVFHRFEVYFESLEGTREESIRTTYIKIGWKQFLETPIGGIGIGNSPELLGMHGEEKHYLHNNFVELLACGGIIGFTIFYSIYVNIGYHLLKFRQFRTKETTLCLILLALLLVMDYGMVSYPNKQHYLYFIFFFLQVSFLKEDFKKEKQKKAKLSYSGILPYKRSTL